MNYRREKMRKKDNLCGKVSEQCITAVLQGPVGNWAWTKQTSD